MFYPHHFFDLTQNQIAQQLFLDCHYVWDLLPRLETWVRQLTGEKQTILGQVMEGAYLGDAPIYIGEGARIEPTAYIEGPAYIGAGAVVRHGAFVRENVILLEGAILGHASGAKNALFLPSAHAPHFAYVGDSILGSRVNLGAGTKLSNLGMMSEKGQDGQRPTIVIVYQGKEYDTGLSKLGAILGDGAQTGCNSVLNPGTLIGRNTLVYANASVRKGYYPPDSLIKLRQVTEVVTRR